MKKCLYIFLLASFNITMPISLDSYLISMATDYKNAPNEDLKNAMLSAYAKAGAAQAAAKNFVMGALVNKEFTRKNPPTQADIDALDNAVKALSVGGAGAACDIETIKTQITGLDDAFKNKLSAAKDDKTKANLIVDLFSDKELSGYKAIEAAKAKGANLDAISRGIADAITAIKNKK